MQNFGNFARKPRARLVGFLFALPAISLAEIPAPH
jgi:hypothetical protein